MSGVGVICSCCEGVSSSYPACSAAVSFDSLYAVYLRGTRHVPIADFPSGWSAEGWAVLKTLQLVNVSGTPTGPAFDAYAIGPSSGVDPVAVNHPAYNVYAHINTVLATGEYALELSTSLTPQYVSICSAISETTVPFVSADTGNAGDTSNLPTSTVITDLDDVKGWDATREGGTYSDYEMELVDFVVNFGELWGKLDDLTVEVDVAAWNSSSIIEETKENTSSIQGGTGSSTVHGWDETGSGITRELRMSVTDAGSGQWTLEFHYYRDAASSDWDIKKGFEVTVGEGTDYEVIDDMLDVAFEFNHDGTTNEAGVSGTEDATITFTISSYSLA